MLAGGEGEGGLRETRPSRPAIVVDDDEKDDEETKYGLREDVIWTGRRRDFGCFFNGIDEILV